MEFYVILNNDEILNHSPGYPHDFIVLTDLRRSLVVSSSPFKGRRHGLCLASLLRLLRMGLLYEGFDDLSGSL